MYIRFAHQRWLYATLLVSVAMTALIAAPITMNDSLILIVILAAIEETIKVATAWLVQRKFGLSLKSNIYITAFIFSVIETILYLIFTHEIWWALLIVRMLFSLPMHLMTAPLVGDYKWKGFLLIFLLHTLYNVCRLNGAIVGIWILFVISVGPLAYLGYLYFQED